MTPRRKKFFKKILDFFKKIWYNNIVKDEEKIFRLSPNVR